MTIAKILVTKGQLQSLLWCAYPEVDRERIHGVYLLSTLKGDEVQMISTDGHRLLRIMQPVTTADFAVTIHYDDVKALVKRARKRSNIEFCIDTADNSVSVVVDDSAPHILKTVESAFPDWRAVMRSQSDKSCASVGLNPQYLADVGKIAAALEVEGGVLFDMPPTKFEAVRLDIGRDAVMMLMPMRH